MKCLRTTRNVHGTVKITEEKKTKAPYDSDE